MGRNEDQLSLADRVRGLAAGSTDGPWEAVVEAGDEWWFGKSNQARIKAVSGHPDSFVAVLGGDKPGEIADARLIAAAPVLLDLLCRSLDMVEDFEFGWHSPERTKRWNLRADVERLLGGTDG